MRAIGSHERPNHGATNVWLTPRVIVDSLGPFDLDPCAAPDPRPWPTAHRHYVEAENGLSLPWRGRVWMNPPYGEHVGLWLDRLAQHRNGIALVFARTDTEWFHNAIVTCSGLFFPRKRITFHYPDGTPAKGNAGAPSVFLSYGKANAKILQGFKALQGVFFGPGEIPIFEQTEGAPQ